ncbi:unnamed protein product [Prunus armeniaca]|uniref:Uncharacterized protein n=1 Tax=Prunus armeniaca TaxID=36596 RepID=A0A6J5XQ56_PRUAR|nr:unnamed protein product [Prunus armeniaca]
MSRRWWDWARRGASRSWAMEMLINGDTVVEQSRRVDYHHEPLWIRAVRKHCQHGRKGRVGASFKRHALSCGAGWCVEAGAVLQRGSMGIH